MSILTFNHVTNIHEHHGVQHLLDTVKVWGRRRHDRAELAHLTERELHDVGLSQGDALYEASKPFWQA